LTSGRTTIAVAGTHGKTTTSAMIAWVLTETGQSPSFIVGGVLQTLETNAQAGLGPHFVVEADEYDYAFLGLAPDIAIVTTLEHDHPDCYPTFAQMQAAFREFVGRVAIDGLLIVCGDETETRELGEVARGAGHRVQTYGLDPDWDWWAEGDSLGNSASFKIWHRGSELGRCAIQLPGQHNVLNALAALAACHRLGIAFGDATAALARFRGTGRRFEVKGHVFGVTIVDDYAHHPTEIRATLAAARLKYPGRSVWAVFQPHTYSRTATLLGGFTTAFGGADHVLVTPIYAAREKNRFNVSGQDVVSQSDHPDIRYVNDFEEAVKILELGVEPGDVVITLGAGDGYLIGDRLLSILETRETSL
jgi:UDP-N-acetylmuramate--alanine ligase